MVPNMYGARPKRTQKTPRMAKMTYAAFRTSHTFHYRRPPRRCAARIAWDMLAEGGEIVKMRLLDGQWAAKRPDGEWDEVDAAYVRQALVENRR